MRRPLVVAHRGGSGLAPENTVRDGVAAITTDRPDRLLTLLASLQASA
jgi:glycerophosphoryl diester phosphodiesterase